MLKGAIDEVENNVENRLEWIDNVSKVNSS
ncbi:hypothetical protein SDC9_118557 [bioreactor metagenome]|uniref:Uncharacterized protein n=1 Tax=bioreactor metagenome TaxID=1076179 RepID=A0A645C1S5_9ZZZZ